MSKTIAPNLPHILAHLEAVAAPYIGEYDDGLIELAYTAPGEFAPNRAKLFGLDQLQEAAEFAASQNAAGCNFYIGAALRSPEADPNKRADFADLYAAAFAVVEADEDADGVTNRITSMNGEIGALPQILVLTGTMPEKRIHYWIRLHEICDDFDALSDALAATVASIGADPKVKDAARIMRLGGTVNHISKSKADKGYACELTVTRASRPDKVVAVPIEKLARAKPLPGWQSGRDGGAGAIGAMGEIVKDEDGKVIDGREAFWMQIVMKSLRKYLEELDQDPSADDLYAKCFDAFSKGIDGNGRWTSPYGQKNLRKRLDNTLRRLKEGSLARSGLYSRETKTKKAEAEAKQREYQDPLGNMEGSGMPIGYRMRNHGVEMKVEDKDGNAEWHWICSPIRVLSLPRSHNGEDWGRLLLMRDPDGNIKRWAMPAELLASDGTEMRKELMRLGVEIAFEGKKRQAFQNLLVNWRPERRSIVTQKLGWADTSCSAFALGNGDTLGDEDVVYQSPVSKTAAAGMQPKGDLKQWTEGVVPLLCGNPLLVFATCMSFGSPLLELTGTQGGGVNLRGQSSKGKTTALEVAASVWGSPSIVQTWRATDNGLEGTASAFNSVLLCLDEMGQVAPKVAGAAAYMLANGRGKGRAGREGQARKSAEWSLLFLSSGEISLADKMHEAGEKTAAGQAVRILDIEATSRGHGLFDNLHGHAGGHEFSQALRVAVSAAHGTAGPKFIKHVLDHKDEVVANTQHITEVLRKKAVEHDLFKGKKPDGQVQRAIQRLGVILADGVTAHRAGLFPIPEVEILNATLEVLKLWIMDRGGVGGLEAREAIERTRSFILTQDSRFERKQKEGFAKTIVRSALIKGRLAAISCTVLSSRSASSSTAALNWSEKFRRFVILVSFRSDWIHLCTLSEFAGPLQL